MKSKAYGDILCDMRWSDTQAAGIIWIYKVRSHSTHGESYAAAMHALRPIVEFNLHKGIDRIYAEYFLHATSALNDFSNR